jgi:hypothetical protein
MAVLLGQELIQPLEQITALLDQYDLETQRLLIGFLTLRHSIRGTPKDGKMLIDGVHKHAKQILRQCLEFAERGGPAPDGGHRMMALLHGTTRH